MIKLDNVSKSFGEKEVLHNISLKINDGDFVAITGVNGAGKTTLVNLIVGTQEPSSGTIDTSFEQKDFGLQIQDVVFNKFVTPKLYIDLQKDLYDLDQKDVDEMTKIIGVDSFVNTKIKKLSGGQRQRLNILVAILHKPKVMIFDELTTGLDALSRYEVREILRNLNKKGTTIILVSHYMDEIEDLCKKVISLKDGKLKDYATISTLLKRNKVKTLDEYFKKIMMGVK
ncbi:MAG: ABC transporter ATP-binding protein [Mycoplasmatales bacterium]